MTDRVLVTGASGFVGRHVTAALAAAGADVHAVSTRSRPARDGITWHTADLLDAAERDRVVASVKASSLIHLAWCAKPPGYWRDPDNVRWLSASLELVRTFAAHGGTRVLGTGTCAEYDWSAGRCRERVTPLAPETLYGAAKAACGTVLEAFGRETGLSVAWARLFFLFGPGDAPVRLVPSLVLAMSAGRPARCTTGSHVRDYLYIEDAAEALVALLRSGVTGPVNIASGVPVHIGDLAGAVADLVGRPDLLTVEDGPADNARVTADITRLRDEVGWRPRHDRREALAATVRWWQSADAGDRDTVRASRA